MSVEIYPVVHVKDTEQAVEQSSLAYELGADGVYLIDHENHHDFSPLVKAYSKVSEAHSDKFIGLNFLQLDGFNTFRYLHTLTRINQDQRLPDAIWVDDPFVTAGTTDTVRNAISRLREIQYVGGVAFKGNLGHTEDPQEAAQQATRISKYLDVVATSGPGTGIAANPAKVEAIKEAIKPKRLAIASGISEENLHLYRDHIDEILVSTSVETSPQSGIFDEERLRTLIELAHED